ncbi:HDOD domain-containing protein [Aestuariibacter sp. AA17]|uniref:HDOD domain-containing protein n=1 Tax=Fluctibacter corallii TaxID=2984329 RepID=A0ABT3A4H6_9ALTE|nr:HDOD domain-containing protein [Aestuariibacter sp. AA17]MCV2883585.1 HDOD domain-containing protein [Aestuariibacter sp. AA17]
MFDINDETLEKLKKTVSLPSRPSILVELDKELRREEPDLNAVSALLAKDVGLSAGILKILNSPAFGLSREVRDVKHGATILGLEAIKGISTAYFLKQTFDQGSCCILLEPFWDRATMVARAAVKIGMASYCNVTNDLMYLAGLFHNCGVPVMAIRFQDYGITMLEAQEDEDATLVEKENALYDTSHNVVGYFLSRSWHLPKSLSKALLHSQDRSFFDVEKDFEARALVAVMKAAENAISMIFEETDLTEWRRFGLSALAELELSVDEYQELVDQLEREVVDLTS